ncbi:MAG TPA: hypothetical protein VLH56_19085 [Dissulfurispiraceae bacterium]|nr:hypothetical protein [Dissulfurispiraceae bacterium]
MECENCALMTSKLVQYSNLRVCEDCLKDFLRSSLDQTAGEARRRQQEQRQANRNLEWLRPASIDLAEPTVLIHARISAETTSLILSLQNDPERLAAYVDLLRHHFKHLEGYIESKNLQAEIQNRVRKRDVQILNEAKARVEEQRKSKKEKTHEADLEKIKALLGLEGLSQ